MAVIAQTQVTGVNGPVTLTRTTSGASDTLVYAGGTGQKLELYNTTGLAVVATIIGSTATTISPAGYGATLSVAAGLAVSVPANGWKVVSLDNISAYLSGTVSVTGGTGLIAALYA